MQEKTLSELIKTAHDKHPHVAELAALREQAQARVDSMLDTLHIARKHSGLTQKAVARKLGVSQATISRWESGEDEISLRDFVFFMQACNEKVALVAVPGTASFSEEDLAREIIDKLMKQLYPNLNIDELLSMHAGRKIFGNREVLAKQAKVAAQTAASSFIGLGMALEHFEQASIEIEADA